MKLYLQITSIILFYIGLSTNFFSLCVDACLGGVSFTGFEFIYNYFYTINDESRVNALFLPIVFLNFLNIIFFVIKDSKYTQIIVIFFNKISIIYLILMFFNSRGFHFPELQRTPSLGWLIVVVSNILFILSYYKKFQMDVSFKRKLLPFISLLTTIIIFVVVSINNYFINETYFSASNIGGCDLSIAHLEYNQETGKQMCIPNEGYKREFLENHFLNKQKENPQ